MIASTIQMNLDQFYSLAVANGFQNNDMVYMTILYAQARLETGNFTSRVYMDANNMFGMRPTTRRAQNRVGVLSTNNGEFAKFQTLNESFRDRVEWDSYNNIPRPQTLEEARGYMERVMSKGYTHESTYISTWLQILSSLIDSGVAEIYGQSPIDVEGLEGGEDGEGLFDGTGGLGLIEGINKFKVKYGIIGLFVVAVLGWFAYKRFKNK